MRPLRFFGEVPELDLDKVMKSRSPAFVALLWDDRARPGPEPVGSGRASVVPNEGILEVEVEICPEGRAPSLAVFELTQTRNGPHAMRTRAVCSKCHGVVSKLYYAGGEWACGKCHALKYRSQYPSNGPRDHSYYDKLSIEAKRPKRKNEHWESYKRRQQEAEAKLARAGPLDEWTRRRQALQTLYSTTYLGIGDDD